MDPSHKLVGAPEASEVGWCPKHHEPVRVPQEASEPSDALLLQPRIALVDAEPVYEDHQCPARTML
eukprot:CAMPEP_0170580010 /NCGR_PEP_ID=MMETSP0224-20130122/6285_1 /TAXON_ID=285029 /ORGANISM="Togula jolla, Strain CCCM 725" /LENGTH=65 /DNA_ID=CAMNT_0010903065 /DNA_START=815 /DNA_END=1012 /DNA_ORIENTATION=-